MAYSSLAVAIWIAFVSAALSLSPAQNATIFLPRTFAPALLGSPLVQSVSLTAPERNNFPGYVGMQFTTGRAGVTVSELGRWVIAGNSQSHPLELVDASTGSAVAATTLNTAGLPAGFAYASLPSPVTLSANHSYYLMSLETSGGDYWYDNSETVTPSTLVKSIDSSIYSLNNSTWVQGSSTNSAYVPVDLIGAPVTIEDEFVGPFASWVNVKTSCGAAGDGVTDDTSAIQTCINNLATTSSGTLYFPAGTYKITTTITGTALYNIQIIGADPATTQIKWFGASGGTMWLTNGYRYSREARITWNGNNLAGTIAYHQENTNYGTTVEYNDEVYENAAYGWRIGNGASNADDTQTILRCSFINLTTAGISVESNNAVEIWVWYSTFQNDAIGMTNFNNGAYNSLYNIFLNNTTADIYDARGDFLMVQGNYSSGSNQFYHHINVGQATDNDTFQANTVINNINSVSVQVNNPQQMYLIDNIICSANTSQTTPSVTMSATGATGGNIGSIGNIYTTTSEPTVSGTSTVLWTQQDTNGVACPATVQPSYPTPPNNGRHIIDVAPGATAATIQAAITSAVAYQGAHPVVHLPAGTYSIASTLTIPANLDVQLIGDGFGTILVWTGTSGGTILSLTAPSKALLQDFYTQSGNLTIHTSDVPGARIQAWGFLPTAGSINTSISVSVTGLTNTSINFYDYSGQSSIEGVITGTGSAVPSTVSFFGAGFDGFGSNGTFQITGNANLLAEMFWEENSGQIGAGGTFGTFSGAAGTISLICGDYQDKTTNSPALVTLAGYIGQFLWLSGKFAEFSATIDGTGPVTVTSPTSSTNVLFMGDYFAQTGEGFPFWNVAAGGNVYGKNNQTLVTGTGSLPTADTGGTPSSAAMTAFLAQMRSHFPTRSTSLPAGVDDVRLDRLWIDRANTALTVTTP